MNVRLSLPSGQRLELLSICLAVAGTLGCDRAGSDHARGGTRGDEALRLEIEVEESSWPSGREWHLVEEFRLGGRAVPGEEIFGNDLTSVAIGPGGNTYVLEDQTREIRVFDRGGRHLRTFGGEGDGPGELRSPRALTFDPQGRLWVVDVRRYTIFDTTGALVRTVRRPLSNMARFKHEAFFLGPNRLVDETWSENQVTFVVLDTLGQVVASTPLIPDPRPSVFVPYPPNFDRRALAFREGHVWTHARDGTIWHSTSGAVELVQRSVRGDTLEVYRSNHRTARFPRRSWVESEIAKLDVPPDLWPLAPPMIQKIHVLDDGTILLLIGAEASRDGRQLDVLSPEGRYLGTIEMDSRLSSRGMMDSVGDTLLFVGIGELDIPYVIRAHLERGQ